MKKRPPDRASQILVQIEDQSSVGEARRQAATLARALALDPTTAGNLALAVTEAAANIAKHAGHGLLALRVLQPEAPAGVELLAIDKGPGMSNIGESMRDGHSTAGSPGTGLGALRRMTQAFELYTQPGGGTLLRCELWASHAAPPKAVLALGALRAASKGESICGDDWFVSSTEGVHTVLVVDGLGHGADAAQAAAAAVDVARLNPRLGAADLMTQIHDALRPTRGAAGAVAVLNRRLGVCTYCGVGNISGSLHTGDKSRSMVSHNGILGHHVRRIAEFSYPLADGALCIVHSDGLTTRWNLEAYPGLTQRHPALVAAALYRDFKRMRDDVTVVALRAGGRG